MQYSKFGNCIISYLCPMHYNILIFLFNLLFLIVKKKPHNGVAKARGCVLYSVYYYRIVVVVVVVVLGGGGGGIDP